MNIANEKIMTRYKTRRVEVNVEFATQKILIQTLEGSVHCRVGDAIITGVANEQWPVQREVFESKYIPVKKQTYGDPGLYFKRTSYIDAYQILEATTISLTSGRGTLHGKFGDWIIYYAIDDAAIVAQDIFHKLYEPA